MATLADIVADTARAHAGHKWILTFTASASLTEFVDLLRGWGDDGVMVISAVAGVGGVPDVPTHLTGSSASSMMDGIRSFQRSILEPDAATQAAVDEFDPEGIARVITEPFNAGTHVLGRRVFGPRMPSWLALEDKIVVDELWDAAGVSRAPSAIVPVADAAQAASLLSNAQGTVWAADTRQGWHGGAAYTRWVADAGAVQEATEWFRDRAHKVRVMPFLDGIPCSIHGFVASDGVAAFRPVEMLILRTRDHSFRYAGPATVWDPPAEIRAAMRDAAKKTARYLAASVDYVGPFSIDGVCTADGFMPTEINTRYSLGIGLQARAADIPLGSVARALVEDLITVPAAVIEAEIVARADAARVGGLGMPIDDEVESAEIGVDFDDGQARQVAVGNGWGDLRIGPTAHGSYMMLRLDPDRVPVGSSAAPLATSAIALATAQWDLQLPPLTPAPDVCR